MIDILPETFQAAVLAAINDTRVAVADWMGRGGLYAETIEAVNAARVEVGLAGYQLS